MAYRNLEVSQSDFEIIKRNQIFNHDIVYEQNYGSRRNLYNRNNKLVATTVTSSSIEIGVINKKQFMSFIGNFNRVLYQQFYDNPNLYDLNIKFSGASKSKNNKIWNELEVGEFFLNIDLDSAYWQILHKLGYIDYEFYDNYRIREGYKQMKRICVSFLSRSNSKTYYVQGEVYQIRCETKVLKKVYSNVRYTLYNIINEVLEAVPCIYYNIDSVSVRESDSKTVRKIFEKYDLEYKLTLCQKKADTLYQFGRETRQF